MDDDIEKRNDHDQFEGLIQGLIDNKYGCCDNFFDNTTITGLRNNINKHKESEDLRLAGFGNKTEYKVDTQFRGDKLKWIESNSEDEFEKSYLLKVSNFMNHLNKTCFTSIKEYESHYANFEKKSFYKRHLDQFKTDKGRQYSIILYLNDSWQIADDGMLSLYPEGKPKENISPNGGRMVFFKSDEMEHEVNPSFTRERLSIAGWLKN